MDNTLPNTVVPVHVIKPKRNGARASHVLNLGSRCA
jgi:hypothetical protein